MLYILWHWDILNHWSMTFEASSPSSRPSSAGSSCSSSPERTTTTSMLRVKTEPVPAPPSPSARNLSKKGHATGMWKHNVRKHSERCGNNMKQSSQRGVICQELRGWFATLRKTTRRLFVLDATTRVHPLIRHYGGARCEPCEQICRKEKEQGSRWVCNRLLRCISKFM